MADGASQYAGFDSEIRIAAVNTAKTRIFGIGIRDDEACRFCCLVSLYPVKILANVNITVAFIKRYPEKHS
ncbi:MAG TPA: hypothetical protein VLA64_00290 [Azonexus sp.]|nr:hypothetical protein [Azonexus sp.]